MRGNSAGARGRALPRPASRQRNLSLASEEPKASSNGAPAALPLLSSSAAASNPSSASTSACASPYLFPSSPAGANSNNNNGSNNGGSNRTKRRALLAAALWTLLGLWLLSSAVGRGGGRGAKAGGGFPAAVKSSRRHGLSPPPPPSPTLVLSPPAALAARVDALAAWAGPELLRPALRVALSARELQLAAASASSSSSPSSSSSSSRSLGRESGGNGTTTAAEAVGAAARRTSTNYSSASASASASPRGLVEDDGAAAAAAVAAALADDDDELSLALGLQSPSASSSSSSPPSESLKAFDIARVELSEVLSASAAAAGRGGEGGGSPLSPPPPLLACPLDPTLPISAASAGGPVLVAADVSNAERVAPHLVVQAAHLLALLPREQAFLSIYESGSSDGDATRDWLLLAKALASALGSPSRVIAAGKLERRPGQNRIEFLAEARNRALQPLWSEEGMLTEVSPGDGGEEEGEEEGEEADGGDELYFDHEGVPQPAPSAAANSSGSIGLSSSFSRQQQQHQQPVASSRRAARVAAASEIGADRGASAADEIVKIPKPRRDGGDGSGTNPRKNGGWPAERVLFLNDVFFCASDALRLLAHVDPSAGPEEGKVDMSCGLDFDRPRLQDAGLEAQIDLWVSRLARKWRPFPPYFLPLPRSVLSLAPRLWPKALLGEWKKEGGEADLEFQSKAELQFYDIWVARDASGKKFEKAAPHVSDPYSLPRVSRGLPFPVKCCWNGLVAMDAAPFVVGKGGVGAGRREWRRREREKERREKSQLGGGDSSDETWTSASTSSPLSFPPLRFRAAGKGECAASECSLLCNDLLRRGAMGLELEAAREAEEEQERGQGTTPRRSSPLPSPSSLLLQRAAPARMLVDPGVRVAYTLADAAHLRLRDRVRGIAATTWAAVSSAPAIDWGDNNNAILSSPSVSSFRPRSPSLSMGSPALLSDPSWEACCLKPGADAIVWSEDCGWDSWQHPSVPVSFLGENAARRRREAGLGVDERATVVGGDAEVEEEEEEEQELLPPPRKK